MEQAEARRRAKKLGGIAVGVRWRDDHWLLGGWASQPDETWIVTDIERKRVLDDGGVWTTAGEIPEFERPQCATEGCENDATPEDHTGHCLGCNPYGDSAVMNNSPEYLRWLYRADYGDLPDDGTYSDDKVMRNWD